MGRCYIKELISIMVLLLDHEYSSSRNKVIRFCLLCCSLLYIAMQLCLIGIAKLKSEKTGIKI